MLDLVPTDLLGWVLSTIGDDNDGREASTMFHPCSFFLVTAIISFLVSAGTAHATLILKTAVNGLSFDGYACEVMTTWPEGSGDMNCNDAERNDIDGVFANVYNSCGGSFWGTWGFYGLRGATYSGVYELSLCKRQLIFGASYWEWYSLTSCPPSNRPLDEPGSAAPTWGRIKSMYK